MARLHEVRVEGIPPWVPADRLLAHAGFAADGPAHVAQLPVREAADVEARLRNVWLDGAPLELHIRPRLPRPRVREARTAEARRHRSSTPGFTRPDARTDEAGRRYLTPEALALEVADRVRSAGVSRVVDWGCGCGGNAIAFARRGLTVHAVEADPERAALARHNAAVYGVADRITVHALDAADALDHVPADPSDTAWFVDPPWGVERSKARTTPSDLPLLQHVLAAAPPGLPLWAKLPTSFATDTLAPTHREAVFGQAEGDRHRIKFLLVADSGSPRGR